MSLLPSVTRCIVGPAAMDTIRLAWNELAQSSATMSTQVQHMDDTQFRTEVARLAEKINQAMQGLLLFGSTEPDRMRSYAAGAGQAAGTTSILDRRVVQHLDKLTGERHKFRQWNDKFKKTLKVIDKAYTNVLGEVEKELKVGTSAVAIDDGIKLKLGDQDYEKFAQDLHGVLINKAEGEAYDKIKNVDDDEGLQAYMILYKHFTDLSGLGLQELPRRIIHPEPPKDESGLADAIEGWCNKVIRYEGFGDEYKLPPSIKVSALKMLMVGMSKTYFDMWESDHTGTQDDTFFNSVLAKAKDYARKKKLDTAIRQKHGDPMDIGYTAHPDAAYDEQYVEAVGGKGKGCWTCGSLEHIARMCPKGKGRGKGGGKSWNQGACNLCGEHGHWARECPYGAPGGPAIGDYIKGGQKGQGKHAGWGSTASHKGAGKGAQWGSTPGDDYYYHSKGYATGKGKGPWKGKGKGVNEFENYEGDISVGIGDGDGDQDDGEDGGTEWVQVVKKRRGVNIIEKKTADEPREVHELSEDGQWEKIRVQVDSGAFDWVTPKGTAKHVPIMETEASKKGMSYSAANGSEIKAYGEKVVRGFFDEGFGMHAKMQVADVKRTLASVMSMNRTGNKVVLDGQHSYLENKKTGRRIQIHIEGNQYVFYIWVKAGCQPQTVTHVGEVQRRWVPNVMTPPSNRYAVLAADDECSGSGFSRQDRR